MSSRVFFVIDHIDSYGFGFAQAALQSSRSLSLLNFLHEGLVDTAGHKVCVLEHIRVVDSSGVIWVQIIIPFLGSVTSYRRQRFLTVETLLNKLELLSCLFEI
jgi:hypothetical protein